ncbi:bifunctional metallophosphatase/5'-nucleotidase [Carnobacteriaceae bacterium zg-ZUI240]|nr:bifunctional metallophosphatase/5'-nucleotidase [Carnobacteriaceae bacterium zg-ZUI240]
MEIKLLATSDMHGYILPTNYGERNMNLPFGTAKVASTIKHIKKEANGPVVTIDNGDFIQGSPLSYFVNKSEKYRVNDLTQVINAIGYDLGVLGNHEFNYGMDYLKQAVSSYQHNILCANILKEDGTPIFDKAYEIKEFGDVKVAFLGVTTQYIPNWEQPATIKGLTFKGVVETVKEYMPVLKKEADIVVVVYHGGFERDLQTGEPTELITGENEGYALVHEVEGIDALITGHQHRVIAQQLNGVPVVQPGQRGEYVGEISLQVEKVNGKYTVTSSSAKLHPTGEFSTDEEIMQLVHALQIDVEEWLDQPAGKVVGDMTITNPHEARLKEHPYIEFIQRVQMDATGADISGTALFNNEGRGFNPIITMRDIITNYIYPNTLAVVRMSGQDLKDAIEQTAQYFIVEDGEIKFNPVYMLPKPQYYNYDMFEGVEYTINFSNPLGSRVVELCYKGEPLSMDATIDVVTNQYRAVGGGNYTMYGPEKIVKEVQIDMTELIADYLKKYPTIETTVNHNYKVTL